VNRALGLGINFIDTAPLYGKGESERRIGKALKGKRHEVFLATAVMRGDPYTYDNTIRSVEDSLKRLGTDYVDLIQMHELDRDNAEIVKTIPAFLKLKEQGKLRAIGGNAADPALLVPFIRIYRRFRDGTQSLARKRSIISRIRCRGTYICAANFPTIQSESCSGIWN